MGGRLFPFWSEIWWQLHFWAWKSIFGNAIRWEIFNRYYAGLDCILNPLCNWLCRIFIAWPISMILRNKMIFGIDDLLGGGLARVVRKFSIIFLQALVTQMWINFTTLKQLLEKDHAPNVARHNIIVQWKIGGYQIYPVVWRYGMQLTMWYCVESACWLRSGDCRKKIFLTRIVHVRWNNPVKKYVSHIILWYLFDIQNVNMKNYVYRHEYGSKILRLWMWSGLITTMYKPWTKYNRNKTKTFQNTLYTFLFQLHRILLTKTRLKITSSHSIYQITIKIPPKTLV